MSKQRTTLQNRSLHKYFALMSEGLNGAGFDQVKFYETIKHGFAVSWSPEAFKDFWRSVAITLYPEITSTADLDTKQLEQVYLVVDRGVSEKTGVSVPWPSESPPLIEEHSIK